MDKTEMIARIKDFSLLKEKWDSYYAKPISLTARARAIQIVKDLECATSPRIVPGADGSINFEWDNIEVAITSNGDIQLFIESEVSDA